jgi:putative copper export protein
MVTGTLSLTPGLTAVRLTLHVLAAAVFVGGQITMVGLLPDLRRLGGDGAVRIARAFAKVTWPAYGVLLLTGIWNVAAVHPSHATSAWKAVLMIKIVVAVLAGVAAGLHQRATSKKALAIWGSVAGTASIAALVLGVLLAG